jgi:hypothetical protein
LVHENVILLQHGMIAAHRASRLHCHTTLLMGGGQRIRQSHGT